MSITLIQASWSRQLNPSDDTPFNRLFTDSAHQQELMVVRLGDPDIHSSAPVENVAWPGRLVTDGTAIRLILSDHDVMQLPAVVVRAEDGSTAVHYLPQLPEGKTIEATDGPSVMRGPEGEAVSDCLFRQAMDAYNAFDINTSARL